MKGESMLGPSPSVNDNRFSSATQSGFIRPRTPTSTTGPLVRDSRVGSGMHNDFIGPITPVSAFGPGLGPGLPLSLSELDSTPIQEAPTNDQELRKDPAESDSPPTGQAEAGCQPRATLNSTQQDRETGTYANSWAKFQNVQL